MHNHVQGIVALVEVLAGAMIHAGHWEIVVPMFVHGVPVGVQR